MSCKACQHPCKKFGRHPNGTQRYRCTKCKKTYTEGYGQLEEMRIPFEKAIRILAMLVEGISVRSIERLTGTHRDTVLRLLVLAGEKCEKLMGKLIVNVPVKDVQCDEIWGYVYKKETHKWPEEAHDDSIGDAYCFIAMERHSKIVLNFALGRRSKATTEVFIEGLRHATASQPYQITTDGFQPYAHAIEDTLSDRVDYAQMVKVYRSSRDGEQRYSPAEVISTEVVPVVGNPDPARICTSHIERQNLTLRMQIRRLTRLTNAFSKKWENLWAALCLHFAWYNFVRVHRTLRVTPAMAAGIADHVWEIGELLNAR